MHRTGPALQNKKLLAEFLVQVFCFRIWVSVAASDAVSHGCRQAPETGGRL